MIAWRKEGSEVSKERKSKEGGGRRRRGESEDKQGRRDREGCREEGVETGKGRYGNCDKREVE